MSLVVVVGAKNAFINQCRELDVKAHQAHAWILLHRTEIPLAIGKHTQDRFISDQKHIANCTHTVSRILTYLTLMQGSKRPCVETPHYVTEMFAQISSGEMMRGINNMTQYYFKKNVLASNVSRFEGSTNDFLVSALPILKGVSSKLREIQFLKAICPDIKALMQPPKD